MYFLFVSETKHRAWQSAAFPLGNSQAALNDRVLLPRYAFSATEGANMLLVCGLVSSGGMEGSNRCFYFPGMIMGMFGKPPSSTLCHRKALGHLLFPCWPIQGSPYRASPGMRLAEEWS